MRGTKQIQLKKLPKASSVCLIEKISNYFLVGFLEITDPVENVDPALHGDTLEGGEHGQHDVVEARDPLVRASPLLQAD